VAFNRKFSFAFSALGLWPWRCMSLALLTSLHKSSQVHSSVGCVLVCAVPSENGKLPFPGMSELNARLRRIVAAFQKSHKRELQKQEQNEKVCMLSS